MKQTIFSTSPGPPFLPILNLLPLFFLLLHPIPSSCIDPYYYNCTYPKAKTCGDGQLISFPFFIQDKQDSFCGYPGFNLTCNNNGQPILKLQDTNFVIREINYNEQSIRVSDAVVSNTNSSSPCLPLISNVSFPADKFRFPASNQPDDDLFLLYNCNYSVTDKLDKYNLNCSSLSDATLAVFGGDSRLGYASSKCEKAVEVPVDRGGSGGDDQGEVMELVRRGFVLNWVGSNCSECEESGGRCGFDGASYFVKCFCPDQPHSRSCQGKKNLRLPIGLGLGLGIGNGVLILFIVLYVSQRRRSASKLLSATSSPSAVCCWNTESHDEKSIESFLRDHGPLAQKRYSYSGIKKMTRSFRDKLGQGGYGGVFKGSLLDGRLVAVKVLKEKETRTDCGEFINEVASISRTSHVNVVALLGFMVEGSKRALVYEFMPNGSLEKYIHQDQSNGNPGLGLETLYQIALGIARGLEYLHRGCSTRILHFDIKPHNILLDDKFHPKISDFGLAKLCLQRESIVSMLGTRGTPGYIAPEVFCRNFGGVSYKSDVYSYGMLVLEMVVGRKNISTEVDNSSDVYFPDWIYKRLELGEEFGAHRIRNEEENQLARRMVIASLWCIQTKPPDRPPMSRVIEMLQDSSLPLTVPPKQCWSYSPPRFPEVSGSVSSITFVPDESQG